MEIVKVRNRKREIRTRNLLAWRFKVPWSLTGSTSSNLRDKGSERVKTGVCWESIERRLKGQKKVAKPSRRKILTGKIQRKRKTALGKKKAP